MYILRTCMHILSNSADRSRNRYCGRWFFFSFFVVIYGFDLSPEKRKKRKKRNRKSNQKRREICKAKAKGEKSNHNINSDLLVENAPSSPAGGPFSLFGLFGALTFLYNFYRLCTLCCGLTYAASFLSLSLPLSLFLCSPHARFPPCQKG